MTTADLTTDDGMAVSGVLVISLGKRSEQQQERRKMRKKCKSLRWRPKGIYFFTFL